MITAVSYIVSYKDFKEILGAFQAGKRLKFHRKSRGWLVTNRVTNGDDFRPF